MENLLFLGVPILKAHYSIFLKGNNFCDFLSKKPFKVVSDVDEKKSEYWGTNSFKN